MGKKTVAYLNLALCILLWGMIPVVSKKVLAEIDNLQMLLFSTILSSAVMFIVMVMQRKVRLLNSYTAADYGRIGVLGFLGTYLYYVLFYAALSFTSAAEGFILVYTWPILVLVVAFIILNEQVTVQKVLALALSFCGIVVIVTQGDLSSVTITNVLGDSLAIIAALVFALFSVLGKKLQADPVVSVFLYFLTALLFIIPTTFLFSTLALPPVSVWFWLLVNGLLVNGISYVFWFKALEHGDTAVISNALYLTPCLSFVYISWFLNEQILPSSLVGFGIILAGIMLQTARLPVR
jgi:drug/metabolite transporter (DMT)-like permease